MTPPDCPSVLSDLGALQPIAQDLVAIRHELHRYPELAFAEHRTSDLVAKKLEEWGYSVTRGIGGTGLVGTLKVGEGSRTIGLRADMDALPIEEKTDLAYASCHAGVMHACGHDGHTAMLLGAARHLSQTRNFSGTLHLIFQPAEEKGFDSGAKAMVSDGLFERFPCDYVFALHNHPGAAQGTFLWRAGAFMAAGDRVFVKVHGVGGHAARPHLTVDPVVAAAAIVMGLQTVVARNIDPGDSAVVTVGRLRAGDAVNVIPQHADIGISVRSFSTAVRARLKERIVKMVHATAEAFGAQVEIDYVEGYPVLRNSQAACELAGHAALAVVGAENAVPDFSPIMGSEDFAYMLQACPGALIRLGNGTGSAGLHTPTYDFNDSNLVVGAAFFSRLTEHYLNGRPSAP
ncbi:amidohydrolase [Acidovorax sp. SRB_14]|uniref:M20 aminoacylase family protein n=1 Tax=Acidovorax sp. SRB_14 TaxID=1962699 RepID=UPI00146E699F|nr:M20 aminoacylase family protein [Acidovorax sp. SRB_14]NMM81322.1 amidohydrolase [Acidovorax sp. SRB_14]NMM88873.1 amidohydrolase [Rhodococcus sp. SRB_17]